jgi:hypothetical protein
MLAGLKAGSRHVRSDCGIAAGTGAKLQSRTGTTKISLKMIATETAEHRAFPRIG